MNNSTIRFWLFHLFAVWATGIGDAHADIRVRVSFNFIANTSGSRPSGTVFSTNTSVSDQVDAANQILATQGRGYSLELVK